MPRYKVYLTSGSVLEIEAKSARIESGPTGGDRLVFFGEKQQDRCEFAWAQVRGYAAGAMLIEEVRPLIFFADEFPTSAIVPSQAVTIVTVLWTVIVLLGVLTGLALLVFAARRKPSIESEFATKIEMREAFARVDSDIKHLDERNEQIASAIFAEIKSGNTSMSHEFSALNRAIGKLEGAGELATALADAIREGARK